jgi:5'-deoxynucleotidase YfbR-like HD superfamily hydrolase
MPRVENKTVDEIIELYALLGEFGQIKRANLMPNGDNESDSHHSFTLALIAYELASQFAPELDRQKIMLYALAHDLPEIITGDVDTIGLSSDDLRQKAQADAKALAETERKLTAAPHIIAALKDYEAKADDEALFVYWIDKMLTIPPHFYDNGTNLRKLGMRNRRDIQQWYNRTLVKLQQTSRPAHHSAVTILELTYRKMHDELLSD